MHVVDQGAVVVISWRSVPLGALWTVRSERRLGVSVALRVLAGRRCGLRVDRGRGLSVGGTYEVAAGSLADGQPVGDLF